MFSGTSVPKSLTWLATQPTFVWDTATRPNTPTQTHSHVALSGSSTRWLWSCEDRSEVSFVVSFRYRSDNNTDPPSKADVLRLRFKWQFCFIAVPCGKTPQNMRFFHSSILVSRCYPQELESFVMIVACFGPCVPSGFRFGAIFLTCWATFCAPIYRVIGL